MLTPAFEDDPLDWERCGIARPEREAKYINRRPGNFKAPFSIKMVPLDSTGGKLETTTTERARNNSGYNDGPGHGNSRRTPGICRFAKPTVSARDRTQGGKT